MLKRRYAGEERVPARSWIALEVGDCRLNYLGVVLFRVHVLSRLVGDVAGYNVQTPAPPLRGTGA